MSLPYSKHNPSTPCCACGRHPTKNPEVEKVWSIGEHGLCDLCEASLREDGITTRYAFLHAPRAGTKCMRCDGCGKIANTEDGEPWTVWTNLPVQSARALLGGIVKPIPCPDCNGTGYVRNQADAPRSGT